MRGREDLTSLERCTFLHRLSYLDLIDNCILLATDILDLINPLFDFLYICLNKVSVNYFNCLFHKEKLKYKSARTIHYNSIYLPVDVSNAERERTMALDGDDKVLYPYSNIYFMFVY